MTGDERQAIVDALLAERYSGPVPPPRGMLLTPAEHLRVTERLRELADLPHDENEPA
jgi:hypothetical protein